MDNFLIIVISIAVLYLASSFRHKAEEDSQATKKPKEKSCPPHKWEWVDQQDGDQATSEIICRTCGRKPGYE